MGWWMLCPLGRTLHNYWKRQWPEQCVPLRLREACRWFGLRRRRKWDWVEDVTGPPMLLKSVMSYNATLGLAHVRILEPGIIYPIDWRYTSQDWKNAGESCCGPLAALLYPAGSSLLLQIYI